MELWYYKYVNNIIGGAKMKRNFYQRIYDNLNCNRELYQQFVNKYNIKPSKYKFNIFENKLKYIESSVSWSVLMLLSSSQLQSCSM